MSWRIKNTTIASKLAFWDSEGHGFSVFTSKFLPPCSPLFLTLRNATQSEGCELAVHWLDPQLFLFFFTYLFWKGEASAVVTVTPSAHPLPFIGGVLVQVDVGDTVDLSDLTSHQVEQSFAKHDLKCAGPRANAAVTLANPSCHLSGWPMRADSCGVPKTNHCCVW